MQQKKSADIKIGTSIMEAFTRMPVETEQLLREFIDNSTTSYYDHETSLNKVVLQQKCVVTIEWDDSQIIIEDNAFGMDEEAFLRALKPNAKASNYSAEARGKYGLGLKYAALNLGSKYRIETTMFGSESLYCAEVDLDLLKTNIETIEYTVSETISAKHYTKIIITDLDRTLRDSSKRGRKKKSKSKEEQLRDTLAMIYQYDLTQGRLDIYLNGIKIIYNEPELLKRKDGGEWFSTFDDSFEFGGKEYAYHGWIAILNEGSLSNAGFSLVQKERALQLNYRPEALFGKSNDFRYQRVIGEVCLDGDSWIVTFTKNAIKWDDFGLEDMFIQSLQDNAEIMTIFKYAGSYRKNQENISVQDVQKWKKDITQSFAPQNSGANDAGSAETKKDGEPTSGGGIETPQNQGAQANETLKENVCIPISYAGVEYNFEIDPVFDVKEETPWLKVQNKDQDNNSYRLKINVRSPFFEKYTDQKSKKLITKMAICVALAQLASKRNGLSMADSQKYIEELNMILSYSKSEE